MKLFEVTKKQTLLHLFNLQKTRSYEFFLAYRIHENTMVDSNDIVFANAEDWEAYAGTLFFEMLQQYPELKRKHDRMIYAKNKYETAGGRYDGWRKI